MVNKCFSYESFLKMPSVYIREKSIIMQPLNNTCLITKTLIKNYMHQQYLIFGSIQNCPFY